jgi:hypothetical protein
MGCTAAKRVGYKTRKRTIIGVSLPTDEDAVDSSITNDYRSQTH